MAAADRVLDAAERAALAADDPLEPSAPRPFGRALALDLDRGRLRRDGIRVAWVTGRESLRTWCEAAVRTARFAHPVVSDEFGMDRPDGPIGELVTVEVISDLGDRLAEALLVHDRIAAVEDFRGELDPTLTVLSVSFTVVTDEAETERFAVALPVDPVTMS